MKSQPIKIVLTERQQTAVYRWIDSAYAETCGDERPKILDSTLQCSPMSLGFILAMADDSIGDLEPFRLRKLGIEKAEAAIERAKTAITQDRLRDGVEFLKNTKIGSAHSKPIRSREDVIQKTIAGGLKKTL